MRVRSYRAIAPAIPGCPELRGVVLAERVEWGEPVADLKLDATGHVVPLPMAQLVRVDAVTEPQPKPKPQPKPITAPVPMPKPKGTKPRTLDAATFELACDALWIDAETIRGPSRKADVAEARAAIVHALVRLGYSANSIAIQMHRDHTSVSHMICHRRVSKSLVNSLIAEMRSAAIDRDSPFLPLPAPFEGDNPSNHQRHASRARGKRHGANNRQNQKHESRGEQH